MYTICILLFMGMITAFAQETHSPEDSSRVEAQVQVKIIHDSWLSQDKFLHFSTSAAISAFAYHFSLRHLEDDEKRGKIYSISITALIGISKELYDKKEKRHFSWKDLFWDGVGLAVGYLLFIR